MKKPLIGAGMALAISALVGPAVAGDRASPTGRVLPGGVIHGKGGVIQYGSGGNTLSGGFNNVDSPTTWDCTYSEGCTITTSAMIQIGNGGDWAICAVVDGNYINPPCPYQGNLPDSGSNGYVVGNSQQNYLVAEGSHTIQTQVYVSSSTSLENWQTTSHLAKGQ